MKAYREGSNSHREEQKEDEAAHTGRARESTLMRRHTQRWNGILFMPLARISKIPYLRK